MNKILIYSSLSKVFKTYHIKINQLEIKLTNTFFNFKSQILKNFNRILINLINYDYI